MSAHATAGTVEPDAPQSSLYEEYSHARIFGQPGRKYAAGGSCSIVRPVGIFIVPLNPRTATNYNIVERLPLSGTYC